MRSHFTASAFTRSANSFLREDERIDELRVEPFLRVGIVMDASCPGFPKSLPNSREIWRFSGLPARQAKEPGMELVNIPTALFRGVVMIDWGSGLVLNGSRRQSVVGC